MPSQKKSALIWAVLLGLLLIGVYVLSPYWTIYQIRKAVATQDAVALSQHVDFMALRQNLKPQLNRMMQRKIDHDPDLRDNPFAALGLLLAGKMVDQAVEVYVSPQGLMAVMNHQQLIHPPESNPSRPAQTSTAAHPQIDTHYASLNRFTIQVQRNPQQAPAHIALERQGLLDWNITDIALPQDLLD